jgi:hypothetical protein
MDHEDYFSLFSFQEQLITVPQGDPVKLLSSDPSRVYLQAQMIPDLSTDPWTFLFFSGTVAKQFASITPVRGAQQWQWALEFGMTFGEFGPMLCQELWAWARPDVVGGLVYVLTGNMAKNPCKPSSSGPYPQANASQPIVPFTGIDLKQRLDSLSQELYNGLSQP